MEITEILSLEAVVPSLKATSKKQLLQELAARAARITGEPERKIFDVLLERERLGTTGVGNGVAIPHGRLPGLKRLYGLFVRMDEAVAFDAIDDAPIDLVFLLLAPDVAGADHLKALARVSRLLRDRGICEKLRASESRDALYAILTEPTTSSQAA
ncbi:MAG: PTS IIA-like nitrogen regulatory protein PtsN [Alphaproteobacteria bacterium]|nr:PTS IIA-like nitrogen regulatory protein PtsN [Alphaproteobacteria bacterium]